MPQMSAMAAAGPISDAFDHVIDFARRKPGTVLAYVLGLHLVLWTVVPILVCPNLQLDLVEDLALGREWQLGYWKHPPLPWLAADALYRLTGSIYSVYLLGPLASVLCLYFVWRLASEVTEPLPALAAVLVLEAVHFYNFSAVKFAHDQMQLPFWALTGWMVYRAISRGRMLDWILSGAFLALAFWSKYAAFALAASIGLFLLADPQARKMWRTPGPYAMAVAFLAVLAPNLWWLATHDFMPFRYVDGRAQVAAHWYEYLSFPLRWSLSQALYILPAMVLLALLYGWRWPRGQELSWSFAQRYAAVLALGPFLVTTIVSTALGRLPVAMWGYPLWSFAPLALVLVYPPVLERRGLRLFAAGFAIVFALLPVAYAADETLEPIFFNRHKATHFPGRQLAALVTARWHNLTGQPLRYVGGAPLPGGAGEFPANNVAVYSPDRPHVLVHGDLTISPWVEPADFDRRGGVLVWEAAAMPDELKARFPQAIAQPPIVLAPLTVVPRPPVTVQFAIVPPRP
jgi:4-amino-4-deoxy-L-arabinose transferase-like glycosyltransferase